MRLLGILSIQVWSEFIFFQIFADFLLTPTVIYSLCIATSSSFLINFSGFPISVWNCRKPRLSINHQLILRAFLFLSKMSWKKKKFCLSSFMYRVYLEAVLWEGGSSMSPTWQSPPEITGLGLACLTRFSCVVVFEMRNAVSCCLCLFLF